MERKIQCQICNVTFTRPEDLIRHSRSHTAEKPFACNVCGKRFGRLDVLHRHGQSHIAADMELSSGGSRACKECAVGRVRCSRGKICQRCRKRGLECVYPSSRKQKGHPQPGSPRHNPDLLHEYNSDFDPNVSQTHLVFKGSSAALNPSNDGSGVSLETPPDHSNEMQSAYLNIDSGMVPRGSPSFGNQNMENNWMIPLNWLSPHYSDMRLADGEFDWLSSPSIYSGEPAPNMSRDRSNCNFVQLSAPSLINTDPATALDSLSPLGGCLVTRSKEYVSETMYNHILQGVWTECDARSIGLKSINLPSRSEMQLLVQRYYEGYHPVYPFLQEAQYQFISTHSWLLLLSVAAIGSQYNTSSNFHMVGSLLTSIVHHILGRRAAAVSSSEDDKLWKPTAEHQKSDHIDLVELQAGILNCVSLLHSGRQSSIKRALLQRCSLVDTCSRLELLSPRGASVSERNEGDDHEDILQGWLTKEARIRTGWMVWLLDSVISYEFGYVNLLRIGDATAPLPCPEKLWCHPTVRSIPNFINNPLKLTDALEILYMEKTLPADVGDFSAIILIFAICRRNKEAISQHQTGLTFWSPDGNKSERSERPSLDALDEEWPPQSMELSKWRNSCCDCLDLLHWAANSEAALAGGQERPKILHLHLARLLLLTPIPHIQHLSDMYAATPSARMSDHRKYTMSRHYVLKWAVHDQYKARLSLVHAGALFWHVRRYSRNDFLEPFGVYAATLVVWAYSVSRKFYTDRAAQEGPALNVEGSGNNAARTSAQATGLASREGSKSVAEAEPTIILLDRLCDDELVQTYIRSGENMSGQMLGVGDICQPSAPNRILEQGMLLLNGADHRAPQPPSPHTGLGAVQPGLASDGWGIKAAYFESLKCLAMASMDPEQDSHPG